MKIFQKNILFSAIIFILIVCFLFQAEKTAEFAYIGLKTWFDNMIVSLFPFMVLMNLLIHSGLSGLFIKPFYFLMRPFFRNTEDAVFVIFFGFLCGFPLGGKCAIDLYHKGKLSEANAEYLLCFCNNIGPAYMLGFFIGQIHPNTSILTAVVCFYVVPLLYGLLLRYTVYKKVLDREYRQHFARTDKSVNHNRSESSLLSVLPDAITGALVQIASLGGYMILFNALRILPNLLLGEFPVFYIAMQSVLEISGGLLCVNRLPDSLLKTACLYAVFSFNGICCHFQTFALMQHTPFSAKKYMLHKIILCSITVLTLLGCLNQVKFF